MIPKTHAANKVDALNSEVYKRFMEEEIEIPFSKQDLYIKEVPER